MNITHLVSELKDIDQDFEFYPTTKEIVNSIFDYYNNANFKSI
jgi:hypothetical protein